MKFLKNRWFLLVLRLVGGGVFLYAGILKLGNPHAFADSIASFRMLPAGGIALLAMALSPFEILVGLLLITVRIVSAATQSTPPRVTSKCIIFRRENQV